MKFGFARFRPGGASPAKSRSVDANPRGSIRRASQPSQQSSKPFAFWQSPWVYSVAVVTSPFPTKISPKGKTYERQVYEEFSSQFPEARILQTQHLPGRFSKRRRQIDLLITEATPAGSITTVIDAKCFKRKVDVKTVDAFVGMLDDIGASRGMLITSHGYTAAALKRAYYNPRELELDILNFSELRRFQGYIAIPYAGRHGFFVRAPLGWVIDGTRGRGCLASIYQRGLDWESAASKKELIYINVWDRTGNALTAEQLDELQTRDLRQIGVGNVTRPPTMLREDVVTRLRIAEVPRYGRVEITGFLEFPEAIMFAVLLTPMETQRANMRRLESLLRQVVPIQVTHDYDSDIMKLRKELVITRSESGQALIHRRIAGHLSTTERFSEAREDLETALALDPDNAYWILKELVPILRRLGDPDGAKHLLADCYASIRTTPPYSMIASIWQQNGSRQVQFSGCLTRLKSSGLKTTLSTQTATSTRATCWLRLHRL